MWNVSNDLTVATGRFSKWIRGSFSLTTASRAWTNTAALCGGLIEKGYVRDSRTQLIYCDTHCFPGWAYEAAPLIKNRGRKVS